MQNKKASQRRIARISLGESFIHSSMRSSGWLFPQIDISLRVNTAGEGYLDTLNLPAKSRRTSRLIPTQLPDRLFHEFSFWVPRHFPTLPAWQCSSPFS